jgi:hypothetical protein
MAAKRKRKLSRKTLIGALGLEPEGRKPFDRYAATTKEFEHKVKHGTSPASVQARRKLGIE